MKDFQIVVSNKILELGFLPFIITILVVLALTIFVIVIDSKIIRKKKVKVNND